MADPVDEPPVRLSSEPDSAPADIQTISDALDAWNVRVTGVADFHQVAIFLRDAAGAVRGGITGGVWGGWLHVVALWVDEDLRGQGFGSRLLAAAEDEAREHGARSSFLETHSFQAPDLYRRHGYKAIAEIEDYPPGESQLVMRKALR